MPGPTSPKTVRSPLRGVAPYATVAALLGLAAGALFLKARRDLEREATQALAKAQGHLKSGWPALALDAVARLPERGAWEADLLTVKGLAYAAMDRPEAVRPVLERSLKLKPNQPIAAKVLAAVYFTGEEADRGFALLEQAARLDADDFRPWFAAGDILLRVQNQPEEAARAFREALRRQPDRDESRAGLIGALLALGSTAEATPLLEAALSDRPGDSKVLRLASLHARLLGRTDEMNRYNEQALAVDPDDPSSLVLRAQDLQARGRPGDALVDAERAASLAPNNLAALSLLARLEGVMGRPDRAAATSARHREASRRAEQINGLRDEIRRRPDDPEARWRMGRAAAEGGMITLAIYSYRVALDLDPGCTPARQGLAALRVSLPSPSTRSPRPSP